MTIEQYLNNHYVPDFRIVTFINNKTEILYDSTKTNLDLSNFLYDSIVEGVYKKGNIIEIEI